jgi:alkyl sulfatase BDS1-like metallo-beta-lactamase superfamily hydrolase
MDGLLRLSGQLNLFMVHEPFELTALKSGWMPQIAFEFRFAGVFDMKEHHKMSDMILAKGATPITESLNALVQSQLPFVNREDFNFAGRGFVATHPDRFIKKADGTIVWDFAWFDFMKDVAAPPTVNPSLWRQAWLLTRHGLFQVTDRIYQVRGFDVSNITFIKGDSSYIVIDPLECSEVSSAAYTLVKQHVDDLPIKAVIYTHTHPDHYAGVGGIVKKEDVTTGEVMILAPEGFLENVASEKIAAGNACARRSTFYQAMTIPKGPRGSMTSGLGAPIAVGSTSLYAPTHTITKTGQTMVIDGVEIVFQLTPDTEAPAEMNFYFPQFRALCMAENANGSIHNILTLRGAVVRDCKKWADYLTQSIRLFGDKTDVMFASHFWPRFGKDRLNDFLNKQRDMYKFMHDQTVRLMNHGYTGIEIGEMLRLPDALDREWFNRGYYGSLSHNSKAIYQKYMGWYDGNPANLHSLPPVEAGKKYVEFMGGPDAVLAKAIASFDQGDYRWTAQVLNNLVYADPQNQRARMFLADTYEQLGYQNENGTWRNNYLMGAAELRHGTPKGIKMASFSAEEADAMTAGQLLDYMSIRLNGIRAAGKSAVLNLQITDEKTTYLITLRNSVLVLEKDVRSDKADATITLTKNALVDLLVTGYKLEKMIAEGEVTVLGIAAAFQETLDLLDDFEVFFPIVEP